MVAEVSRLEDGRLLWMDPASETPAMRVLEPDGTWVDPFTVDVGLKLSAVGDAVPLPASEMADLVASGTLPQ